MTQSRFQFNTFLAISAGAMISFAAALTSGDAFAGSGDDMTVHVHNRTSTDIVTIQSGPPNGHYGVDLLGSDVIHAGYQLPVDFAYYNPTLTCDLWVRATGRDKRIWEKEMNVCTETDWTLVD